MQIDHKSKLDQVVWGTVFGLLEQSLQRNLCASVYKIMHESHKQTLVLKTTFCPPEQFQCHLHWTVHPISLLLLSGSITESTRRLSLRFVIFVVDSESWKWVYKSITSPLIESVNVLLLCIRKVANPAQ
jgi:hypothetical protein